MLIAIKGNPVPFSGDLAAREVVGIDRLVAERRLSGLDLLRLASVIGLVWYHMDGPGKIVAYAGLPAVLTISVALPVMQGGKRSLIEEANRRGRRLLWPWVFWSAFYGAFVASRSLYHGLGLGLPSGWEPYLAGPSIHLWYLPFALVATLAALVMHRSLAGVPVRYACAVGVALGGLTLVLASVASRSWSPSSPFGQWLFGLASIPFGLAVGTAFRARASRVRYVLAGVAFACVVSCLILDRLGDRSTALAYGFGIPLVCLAILWPIELNDFGRMLIPLSLGIYLLHPFVHSQLYRTGLVELGAWAGVAVTLTSALLTLALRRTLIRRFL